MAADRVGTGPGGGTAQLLGVVVFSSSSLPAPGWAGLLAAPGAAGQTFHLPLALGNPGPAPPLLPWLRGAAEATQRQACLDLALNRFSLGPALNFPFF